MTQDELIAMARQAGFPWAKHPKVLERLERFAGLVAAAVAPQPQPKQEPAIIHREIVRIEPDGTETWRETPLYTAPQPQREWLEALREADRLMTHDDEPTEWRERWAHLFYGEQAPQPQPKQESHIKLPTNVEEAELMAKAGLLWLSQYAQDRLAEQPQRKWVGLDSKEILQIVDQQGANTKSGLPMFYRDQCFNMARAISAKLRERNGGGV